MKKILFFLALLILVACKNESPESSGKYETSVKTTADLGKEIFEGKGNCIACHQVDKKVIGPSIQEIVKIYKEQNGNIVSFLKEEAKPIVDPSKYELMKTNFALTEEMSDEELKALEAYMYSKSK